VFVIVVSSGIVVTCCSVVVAANIVDITSGDVVVAICSVVGVVSIIASAFKQVQGKINCTLSRPPVNRSTNKVVEILQYDSNVDCYARQN